MTNRSIHEDHAQHPPRRPGWRRSFPIKWTIAIATLLGVGVLASACGSSGDPSATGSSSSAASGGQIAQGEAYTHCMRSHGVSNFPDPSFGSSGDMTFQGSFNQNTPTYQTAAQACGSLKPGGAQAPGVSAQKLATEVRWARCMRTHGVPSFPDPNAQGAFDSSKFDSQSAAFQTATQACKSLQPSGAVSAVPGPG